LTGKNIKKIFDFCQKITRHLIKHYTIPVFIPELACPFQCAFCNQRKISGHIAVPDTDEIIKIIKNHLLTFTKQNRHVEIGFFGGSFTGLPLKEQEKYLSIAKMFLDKNLIHGIRLSTRPDYINKEVLYLLKDYGVTSIELGAQSFDEEVLRRSYRGHTAKQTEISSKMILDEGFRLGLQMMIGLPGDSMDKAVKTAEKIVELRASCTRIYPTVVVKDTALHNWYKTGKYKPLTLEEAVKWTKYLLPVFESGRVKVIRTGLHPSEGLLSGDELVDGPFHQSFKELVMTEIWYDKFKMLKSESNSKLEVIVNNKDLNFAVGYKAKNKRLLLTKFKDVMFKTSMDIKRGEFVFYLK
jgi:histone acetyltransferase (RNA polymerase elongator complex component)